MSQATSKSRTIDGHTYEVFMLPPKQSRRLLVELVKMLLPAGGPVIDAVVSGGGLKEVLASELKDAAFFERALSQLGERLDNDVLDRIEAALAEKTHVDGTIELGPTFDAHFLGRLETMFKWFVFACQVQWGPTFSGWAGTVGGLAALGGGKGSESPSTSTG